MYNHLNVCKQVINLNRIIPLTDILETILVGIKSKLEIV